MNHSQESGSVETETETKEPTTLSPNALKSILTECLASWIHYLQVLNNLCTAGFKLSQCLGSLAQSQTLPLAVQCQASWDELSKATKIATHTVKTHIAAAMQDMVIGETYTETDAQRQHEHNQLIIFENLLTFVNLQYQFSIAGCEYFGPIATCPCCQTVSGGVHDPECTMATLQQCFARLFTHDFRSQTSSPHSAQPGTLESPKTQLPPGDPQRGSSPSQLTEPRGPSPFQPAHDLARGPSPVQSFIDTIRSTVTSHIENLRGPFPTPGQLHTMKTPFLNSLRGSRSPLHFPLFPLSGQRRWSEAAAAEMSTDSGDGTMRRWSMPWDCARGEHSRSLPVSKLTVPSSVQQERSRSNTPVESPACHTSITGSEGLADAIQLLGSRSLRPQTTATTSHLQLNPQIPFGIQTTAWSLDVHPDDRMQQHKRLHPLYSHPARNWQMTDISPGELFPTRKSSSSTDSSSCLSIHSRSTSCSERGSTSDGGGAESIRLHSNLYSMWSGNDHLPFIRLPESQEPPDDSEDDVGTPNEKGSLSVFPKPV